MKTQIIHLNLHDNTISACDKMKWCQAGRILLVLPGRSKMLAERLDLVLLIRQSQAQGAQLGLISRDSDVCFQARSLGIPVFSSLRKARLSHWKRYHSRKYPWVSPLAESQTKHHSLRQTLLSDHPRTRVTELNQTIRLVVFSFGVLALLAIVAVLLPSAEISLTPEVKKQEILLKLQAHPNLENYNLSGIVPIRKASIVVEGRDNIETTGHIQVPDKPATGFARFTNLTENSISIPLGLIISDIHSNIRFATTRTSEISPGIAKSILVPITALVMGSQGNVPSGRIQTIEGPLGASLSVTNPQPILGGTEITSLAPTASDRNILYDQLLSTLKQYALIELKDTLKPGDVLLSPVPTVQRILVKQYEPANAQAANLLSLRLRVEFTVPIASQEDIISLVTSILDANLPPGYSSLPDTLSIHHLRQPVMGDAEFFQWELLARRKLLAHLPVSQAINLVLGLEPASARQVLKTSFLLDAPPIISLSPSWWLRIPFIPTRINLQIAKPNDFN